MCVGYRRLVTGSDMVKVEVFQRALRCLGEDIDLDEIECMFATYIARAQVRGYVSHGHRTVVFAKVGAFPAMKPSS